MRMRSLVLVGIAASTLAAPQAGRAAELVVLSAAAVRSAVADVPARFETATGDRVRFRFATAGSVRNQVVAGETVDVVIVPPAQLDDLLKKNLVVDGTRIDLGSVRLGVAVRAGSPQPAIATLAQFKQALLEAPSLGLADPSSGATTGIYFAKLLEQMGIAEAIRGKLKLFADGTGAMVARRARWRSRPGRSAKSNRSPASTSLGRCPRRYK